MILLSFRHPVKLSYARNHFRCGTMEDVGEYFDEENVHKLIMHSWLHNTVKFTEYRKARVVVQDIIGLPMAALMCLIVYMIRDWRALQLTIAFLGAFSLVTWFFTHESARWLAQNNRKDEAKDLLLHIAHRNKRKLSQKQIDEIDTILDEVATNREGEETKKLSVLHMFKRQYIFTTAILIIGWICTNLGYYR